MNRFKFSFEFLPSSSSTASKGKGRQVIQRGVGYSFGGSMASTAFSGSLVDMRSESRISKRPVGLNTVQMLKAGSAMGMSPGTAMKVAHTKNDEPCLVHTKNPGWEVFRPRSNEEPCLGRFSYERR